MFFNLHSYSNEEKKNELKRPVQNKEAPALKTKNVLTEKREETPPDPSPVVPVRDLEVQSFLPWEPDPVSLTEPS